jgi:hypothetical protein
LTLDNTHVDRDGNQWDVHKGRCAIQSGDPWSVPLGDRAEYWSRTERIHTATGEKRRLAVKLYAKWLDTIGVEDHRPTDEPP